MYNIEQWPPTLYFDGECPLCAREIKILSRCAIEARLLFFDISRDDFDAKALGFILEQMQSSRHASFADGRRVTGLDATLWSRRAAGLGMWAAPLTWRAIWPLFAVGYSLLCRLRPYLAWLPHPDDSRRCRDNRCTVPEPKTAPSNQPTLNTLVEHHRKTLVGVINRSSMPKFGVEMGQVTLFFHRQSAEETQ